MVDAPNNILEGYTWRMSDIKNDPVLKFIAAMRSAFEGNIRIYTCGHCYEFYLILRSIWPEAEAWYERVDGHVLTKIGDYWYDITGRHKTVPTSCLPMRQYDNELTRAHRWKNDSGLCLVRKDRR